MVGNGYLKKEQSYIKGKHFWSPRHVQKCTILCEPKIRKKIKKQIPNIRGKYCSTYLDKKKTIDTLTEPRHSPANVTTARVTMAFEPVTIHRYNLT